MRRWAAACAALVLASCGGSAREAPAPQPAPPAAPPHSVVPLAPPARPSPRQDTCGARDLQRLVGRPRTEAPVAINPQRQRVACTTCPVTQDYRPDRLNIFFDAATGVIKEVRCG